MRRGDVVSFDNKESIGIFKELNKLKGWTYCFFIKSNDIRDTLNTPDEGEWQLDEDSLDSTIILPKEFMESYNENW